MKILLLAAALMLINSSRIAAQNCFKITKSVPAGIIWQEPVLLNDEKGRKPLVILGMYTERTMVVIIQREWGAACAHKGDTINVAFTDSTTLTVTNVLEDDCEGKYAFYINRGLENLHIADELVNKTISAVTVQTGKTSVSRSVSPTIAATLNEGMRCLASRLDGPKYKVPVATKVTSRTDSSETSFVVHSDSSIVYTVVDEIPEYPGGHEAMFEFLKKNLSNPDYANATVYVSFVVRADGRVDEVHVIRGFSPNTDAVAAVAVKRMPLWKPGNVKGKPVATRFVLPINFRVK